MKIEDVDDKHNFLAFVGELRSELSAPPGFIHWENTTLPDFLEAVQAWAADALNPPTNPWQLAAALLAAGRSYE